jgi:hypothetical protein
LLYEGDFLCRIFFPELCRVTILLAFAGRKNSGDRQAHRYLSFSLFGTFPRQGLLMSIASGASKITYLDAKEIQLSLSPIYAYY